jgi:regulator of cell morphogenesis and NO signaling
MSTLAAGIDRLSDSTIRNWSEESLGNLCNYIVNTHHAFLKQELPRIGLLLYHVAEGDGHRHPELHRVLELFSLFAGDMKRRMEKEETLLFPLIKEIEMTQGQVEGIGDELIHPVELMEGEHEQAGRALEEMRHLTHDYQPPRGACETYRAVLSAMSELEQDIHEHFGLENNILFPRACQMQFMDVI